MKNILIVDDDVDTSLRYKKWLEDEGFILTLINDPYIMERNFKPEDYDLVLIGFRTSVIDGFDLYNNLYEMSKKVQQDTSSSNDFRVCFMTASRINYSVCRNSSRIWRRMLCLQRKSKRNFFKTCLFFDILNLFIVFLLDSKF